MLRILLIDNYDSFTYNLQHLLLKNGDCSVVVKRNDEFSENYLKKNEFAAFVISPGPKRPKNANMSNIVIKKYYNKSPILGVCLGMQCINEFFGGLTIKSQYPMHGKKTKIKRKDKSLLLQKTPSSFYVARYHSLICRVKSEDIVITSETYGQSVPMSIEHKEYPIFGVQFHPESFMSEQGDLIIQNFLARI